MQRVVALFLAGAMAVNVPVVYAEEEEHELEATCEGGGGETVNVSSEEGCSCEEQQLALSGESQVSAEDDCGEGASCWAACMAAHGSIRYCSYHQRREIYDSCFWLLPGLAICKYVRLWWYDDPCPGCA
jgi:hypothetical protein